MTPMTLDMFKPYAHDDPKLSGGLSVFLSTPRADWLKGGTVSVNCESLHFVPFTFFPRVLILFRGY